MPFFAIASLEATAGKHFVQSIMILCGKSRSHVCLVRLTDLHPPPQPPPVAAALPTPATHAYLGEATTASTLSRKDLEVGSTVEMPILSLPGVVLFPGESLPLRLQNPAYAALAEGMLGAGGGGAGGQGQASRHLGVVNRLSSRSGG